MSCSNTCLLLHPFCTIYWFPSKLSKVTQYFAFTFESYRIFEIPSEWNQMVPKPENHQLCLQLLLLHHNGYQDISRIRNVFQQRSIQKPSTVD